MHMFPGRPAYDFNTASSIITELIDTMQILGLLSAGLEILVRHLQEGPRAVMVLLQ